MINKKTINLIKNHKRDYEEILANNTNKNADERLKDIIKTYDIIIDALEKQILLENGKIVELPCNVGDKIYWFWCDEDGNPDGCIREEIIKYFYLNGDGVGISTEIHDGHLGIYRKDGELVDDVLRMFLSREAAEEYINSIRVAANPKNACIDCGHSFSTEFNQLVCVLDSEKHKLVGDYDSCNNFN